MKEQDDLIRKSLQKSMPRIDDALFTDRIVAQHLAQRKHASPKPFFNFAQLIVGLAFVIFSVGLLLLLKTNNPIIESIQLKEQHGLILFLLSLIYLIYKWLEEFVMYGRVTKA